MPAEVIRVALWSYCNAEGKRRLAYFGDSVELTEAEYERAKKAGVFDVVVPDPDPDLEDATPAPVAGDTPAPAAVAVPRPAKAKPKELWVEYAVSQGWDRETAKAMRKEDLVAALTDGEDDDEDDPDGVDAGAEGAEGAEGADQDADEIPVPKKAALLEEWQAYARAKGLSDKDIEGLERQELIQLLT